MLTKMSYWSDGILIELSKALYSVYSLNSIKIPMVGPRKLFFVVSRQYAQNGLYIIFNIIIIILLKSSVQAG